MSLAVGGHRLPYAVSSQTEKGTPDVEKRDTYEGVVAQKGIGALRGKGLATTMPGPGLRRGSAGQAENH